ncbi:hypothetical protein HYH02_008666 [Chlamydomonas schloesseri]|uniref:Uncharacterized protein n=1 Tax=Chlamydomonas schloesseri TaxID=2026947 RepID=A0A835WD73_9CHLO|nr:hypothetical protein HYH02_008666 [Chlamydomonas schloesseri]|eukprot:KAG2445198.1 hypothetical protein HYH02_008666 [Chlamydomonas schloesseri]
MEKQCHRSRDADRWERCRAVLQRGLTLNPTSSCLIQSWGLLELQRGNWLAAVRMLERCARLDVNCRPVLRWQVVQTARKTVGSRRGSGGSGCSAHTCATIEHAK